MKPSLVFCCVFLFVGISYSQKPIQFFSHEEHVKPSMNGEYVAWLTKVKEQYTKNQVNLNYSVFVLDDFTYLFFSQIEDFGLADVYKSFADAEAKVGADAMHKLYKEKGQYINSSQEFVSQLLPQYTYLAPGQGENFRHLMFWVPIPGKEAEADAVAKAWIELHKSKKAPNGYQTFQITFGAEPAWVVAHWGKSPIELETKSADASKLFGQEAGELWARTMAITQKIYYRTGWFLPELSYSYKPTAAK